MTPALVTLPPTLERYTQVEWDIDWRGQSAGLTNNAREQIVNNAFPAWTGVGTLIMHNDQLPEWAAVLTAMQGRANAIRMPMADPATFDARAATVAAGYDPDVGVPLSGGQYTAGGTGTAYDPFVLVAAAASAGSTEIVVDESVVSLSVRFGQVISIADWPYRVMGRVADGANHRLTLAPSLRRAVAVNDVVHLRGWGWFRAASRLPGVGYGAERAGAYTLQLVEWITRP